MAMKDELEALYEENQRLHRILTMIEAKCQQAVSMQLKTQYFAKDILHMIEVRK